MSSALIRQALEFVDQEESGVQSRRRGRRQGLSGQDRTNPYKRPNRKDKQPSPPQTEETIEKLLALSKPTANKETAEKIVRRAIKGKPLIEKIEVKQPDGKSILFADEEEETTINTKQDTS